MKQNYINRIEDCYFMCCTMHSYSVSKSRILSAFDKYIKRITSVAIEDYSVSVSEFDDMCDIINEYYEKLEVL